MSTFYISVYGDGALLGGFETPSVLESEASQEELWAVLEMTDAFPECLREKCRNQGTREQWFSDGYEGYRECVPYIQAVWDTNAKDAWGLTCLCVPEVYSKLFFNL